MNPNSTQIEAAKAVIAQYGNGYRNTGSEAHHNTAVMAIWAILDNRMASVPAEYERCTTGVEWPAPEQLDKEAYEGAASFILGFSADPENGHITLDEAAAAFIRNSGEEFPVAGVYIPFAQVQDLLDQAAEDGQPDDGDEAEDDDSDDAKFEDGDDEPEEERRSKITKTDISGMTVEGLRVFAAKNEIDLSGVSLKADMVAAIHAAGH